MQRVVVLGGTGFVGRAVCEKLFARDAARRIVVPTRRGPHADSVRALPTVDVVVTNVHDEKALTALLQGADALINLVAILHGSAADFDHVHVQLPQKLVRACRAAGVKRVVHVSALGVGPNAPSLYLKSKTAGEAVWTQSGLAVTLLRPSVVFGINDKFLNLFAQLQALAPFVPLAGSGAQMQPVWVQDLAEAVLHGLGVAATPPRVFECVGPQVYTLSQIVRLAGRWAGCERPQIALPGWAATLQAAAMELLPGPPLISRDNLLSLQVPNVATAGVAGLKDLGISASAMDAVAPAYMADRFGKPWLDRWRASRN